MEVRLQTKDLLKWKKKRKENMDNDGWLRQPFHLSRECLVSICICYTISKHGKGDDDNSIIV